ncbi:hypothetical protein HOY80DRAFT_1020438 [Tuber brumale]|nr:hypothetical protein HOY80DRAFT_1020438 [Tuber brumale]
MEPNRMRKIEVQSPEDIRFILENLSSAARAKINHHLPPPTTTTGSSDNDELRKRVEDMVMEYVQRTITLSLPSISINGLDAPADVRPFLHPSSPSFSSTAEEKGEFEAYDRKLHDRVSALYAELERETLRVAQLRREAPGRAKKAFEEALRREGEGDERILGELGRKRGVAAGEEGGGLMGDLGVRELERGEEVAKGYEEGVGVLVGLRSKLPAIAHKLTRAQDALDYVESKRTVGS